MFGQRKAQLLEEERVVNKESKYCVYRAKKYLKQLAGISDQFTEIIESVRARQLASWVIHQADTFIVRLHDHGIVDKRSQEQLLDQLETDEADLRNKVLLAEEKFTKRDIEKSVAKRGRKSSLVSIPGLMRGRDEHRENLQRYAANRAKLSACLQMQSINRENLAKVEMIFSHGGRVTAAGSRATEEALRRTDFEDRRSDGECVQDGEGLNPFPATGAAAAGQAGGEGGGGRQTEEEDEETAGPPTSSAKLFRKGEPEGEGRKISPSACKRKTAGAGPRKTIQWRPEAMSHSTTQDAASRKSTRWGGEESNARLSKAAYAMTTNVTSACRVKQKPGSRQAEARTLDLSRLDFDESIGQEISCGVHEKSDGKGMMEQHATPSETSMAGCRCTCAPGGAMAESSHWLDFTSWSRPKPSCSSTGTQSKNRSAELALRPRTDLSAATSSIEC